MDKEDIETILTKYKAGTASKEEIALLESWYLSFTSPGTETLGEKERLQTFNQVWANLENKQSAPKTIRLWPRIAAAAAILVFLSFGLYTYFHKNKTSSLYTNDIAPGTAKPFLTLANGQKVIINGNDKGAIAKQGLVTITQNAAGQLTYTTANSPNIVPALNTLTNPRGSKVVSIILPDGTLAKLEAGSSLTYLTAFTGKTRNVSTKGKVYFAVKHNKAQPFFLAAKGQTVEDIGTHFIIDAFDDEPIIKTTLIDGSIAVSHAGKKELLKPGQQSLVEAAGNSIAVKEADLDEETAWINGDFDFHNEALGSIMRQLARVYNIEVTYKGDVKNLLFDGMVSRSRNISAVLELMESTGKIHFEINATPDGRQGRRVMVIAGQR